MSDRSIDNKGRRLDLAARAAWLYYIKGRTQDEIATALQLSRPNVQRLVALAMSEGLIKFRLDHPLLRSMELAERLQDRFGLQSCEVAPTEQGDGESGLLGVAMLAAQYIEALLSAREPRVLAVGTGRTLLEAVRQMPLMSRSDHRVVSIVSNLSRDGKASPYDIALRLSDRVGAQYYPFPLPVITDTKAECDILCAQRGYRAVAELYTNADAVMLGVGAIGPKAPLLVDGFVHADEMAALERDGAVGELVSRSFDCRGGPVANDVTARLTAFPLIRDPQRPVVLAAAGPAKVAPIRAAIRGRFATGLITDEWTAAALLEGDVDGAILGDGRAPVSADSA